MPRDENIVDYGYGRILPNYTAKDEPTLVSLMANAIAEYYEKSGAKAFLECKEPGHRWGWKIDSQGVRVVECGCYDEAMWPAVLSLTIGPILKTVGTKVATLFG